MQFLKYIKYYNNILTYSAAQFVVAQNIIHPSTKCGNKITSMWLTKYNTAVLKGRAMSQSDKKMYSRKESMCTATGDREMTHSFQLPVVCTHL